MSTQKANETTDMTNQEVKIQIQDTNTKDAPQTRNIKKRRPRSTLHQRMFIVGIILVCLIVIPYAYYAMRINAYSQVHKPEGFNFPTYSMLWITALSALFFAIVRRSLPLLDPLILPVVPTKAQDGSALSDQERIQVVQKIEGHIFDGLFYLVSSVYGWQLVKDQTWLPWYMGGSGDFASSFTNTPFFQCDEAILTYGLLSFGFRVESLVQHLFFSKSGADFEEMLLHDIVTCLLFYGYIFANLLPVGTLVAILHDIGDVPFHLSKALHATPYEILAALPFLTGQLMWVWFRLFSLPMIIITVYHVQLVPELAQFNVIMPINAAFLSILFCMHVLWFYMFQRLNYNILCQVKVTANTYVINSPECGAKQANESFTDEIEPASSIRKCKSETLTPLDFASDESTENSSRGSESTSATNLSQAAEERKQKVA